MGRHLILACENCIPGDASGWYAPLALGLVLALVGAFLLLRLAALRSGARARLAAVAAAAVLVVPFASVLAMATDVTYDGAICGSALSASLERPRPPLSLDATQEGCRRKGATVLRGAGLAVGVAVGLAALATMGAFVPPRRPAVATA